jgi:hypothetical protein
MTNRTTGGRAAREAKWTGETWPGEIRPGEIRPGEFRAGETWAGERSRVRPGARPAGPLPRGRRPSIAFRLLRGICLAAAVAAIPVAAYYYLVPGQPPLSLPAPLPEEKPPAAPGNFPLPERQVRYCLAQGIRIQAADKAVNTAAAAEVSRFLALVDDFNPRCGNYRFELGVMKAVKEEVEARRAALEREGVTLIRPPAEEIPPAAQGAALREPQVRYCLTQGIRLQGAARAVNTASTLEASRFLTLADDYNSRCGNYRMASGVTNAVKDEVELRRATLEREGAELFRPAIAGR